jgi:signal transduction histidine kinase
MHASRVAAALDGESRDYAEFASLLGSRIRDGLSHSGEALSRFHATGLADEVRNYETHYAQVIAALREAESLASRRHPEHSRSFGRLRKSIENWDSVVRGNNLTSPLPQRNTAVLLLRQASLFQNAQNTIGETEDELRSRMDQRYGEMTGTMRRATVSTGVIGGLAFGSSFLVWLLARRMKIISLEFERYATDEAALRHIAQTMSATPKPSAILRMVAERTMELFNADGAYVERVDPKTNQLVTAAATGNAAHKLAKARPFDGSAEKWVADPVLSEFAQGSSALVIPLKSKQTLGVMVVLRRRAFEAGDRTKMNSLASLATISLRRAMLLEETNRRRHEALCARRLRDEALRVVSHDLTNPITTIRLAAWKWRMEATLESKHHISMILRAAKRMERLIYNLRDVSVVESGRPLGLNLELHEITAIMQEVHEGVEYLAAEKAIHMTFNVHETSLLIRADRDRLIRALTNLVDNAVKFTPRSGNVTVDCRAESSFVRFSISDSGPGIAADDLPRIFNLYWQAPETAHLGSGIGLAMVKRIIEQHGGTVGVKSTRGGGSTFVVALPLLGHSQLPAAD